MDAEEAVFSINDLRNNIFSYLRSEAYKSCQHCYRVLEWNPKDIKSQYIEWGNCPPTCHKCFKVYFLNNYPYYNSYFL